MPKDATGKEGRANHVDVARRSYLEALTGGRGQAHSFRFTKKVGLIYFYDSLFGWLLYRHHRYFVVTTRRPLFTRSGQPACPVAKFEDLSHGTVFNPDLSRCNLVLHKEEPDIHVTCLF